MAFHCWAQRATVRSVRFLPRPPIVTGGCGCCTGFGSHLASVSFTYWPANVVVVWLSSRTMASTPSSNRSNRSFSGGRSIPYASHSIWFQPAPRPSSSRPPLMMSTVAAMLASTAGWR